MLDPVIYNMKLFNPCNRPSFSGNRKDGKVCKAKPGECRKNIKYYTPGLSDAKSWETPVADESCNNCFDLIPEDEIQQRKEIS